MRAWFDVRENFEALEESCIPSYLHGNQLASGISWWRLFSAMKLAKTHAPDETFLDFGAGSGELYYLLDDNAAYDFVEEDEALSRHILASNPNATRRTAGDLAAQKYGTILALDSLEHNDDFEDLLKTLAGSLKPGGILVLSGPTENWLYRLGRRISGFDGHYHKTTIYDIEAACEQFLTFRTRSVIPVPVLAPLFNISVWQRSH